MPVRQDPSSHDYLFFAKQDLLDGKDSRHLVNSISNAKRALHLRLEDLCLGFGAVNLEKLNCFPLLIKYVQKCGVVAPEVLGRLNALRNNVEHRYKVPERAEVEAYVDVVELFLSATDRWRDRQPCFADFYQEVDTDAGTFRLIGLTFDWKKGRVSIKYQAKNAKTRNAAQSLDYSSPSKEYFECVRFLIANNY